MKEIKTVQGVKICYKDGNDSVINLSDRIGSLVDLKEYLSHSANISLIINHILDNYELVKDLDSLIIPLKELSKVEWDINWNKEPESEILQEFCKTPII